LVPVVAGPLSNLFNTQSTTLFCVLASRPFRASYTSDMAINSGSFVMIHLVR
jgi:hypothetical protein